MSKAIFLNIPVKNLETATAFYAHLGFTNDPRFSDKNASCMIWSDNIFVMLLTEDFFATFVPGKTLADAKTNTQMLPA